MRITCRLGKDYRECGVLQRLVQHGLCLQFWFVVFFFFMKYVFGFRTNMHEAVSGAEGCFVVNVHEMYKKGHILCALCVNSLHCQGGWIVHSSKSALRV